MPSPARNKITALAEHYEGLLLMDGYNYYGQRHGRRRPAKVRPSPRHPRQF